MWEYHYIPNIHYQKKNKKKNKKKKKKKTPKQSHNPWSRKTNKAPKARIVLISGSWEMFYQT